MRNLDLFISYLSGKFNNDKQIKEEEENGKITFGSIEPIVYNKCK